MQCNVHDGYNQASGTSYTEVHGRLAAGYSNSFGSITRIGQSLVAGSYSIFRSYLFFDTAILPDSATITSASLSIYVSYYSSTKDFTITVQNGQPTHPNDPFTARDYDSSLYSGTGGTLSTSNIGTGYKNITLSAGGLAWINRAGITKLCLRSSRDINSNVPSNAEWVDFYTAEKGATYAPRLYVTYRSSITYLPSNENLAPVNLAPVSSFSLPSYCTLDSTIFHTVAPSIRVYPSTNANLREAVGKWLSVKPGDHVVARCWIKVDALAGFAVNPNNPSTWRGARILIDLYGHGHWLDSYPHATFAEDFGSLVPWGTSGWVLKTWDFIVPSTVYRIPTLYDPHPTSPAYTGPSQVDSIVMVLNCGNHGGGLDRANGWFSDPELYINPI